MYYKVLSADGFSIHGGDLQWSLPRDGQPGDWHRVEGNILACVRGLHLTTEPYRWYAIGCKCYQAEGRGDSHREGDKIAFREARLLQEVPHPKWWTSAMAFIETIRNTPFLKPDNNPLPEWKLFPTRDAARVAARDAARDAAYDAAYDAARAAAYDAAYDAARDAAWDAALYTTIHYVCGDLSIASNHRKYAESAWNVWKKGYGLAGSINGTLYVYSKVG